MAIKIKPLPKPVQSPAPTTERIALSVEEAAQSLGISEKLLRTLTKEGKIPVFHAGCRVLYPVETLKNLVNNNAKLLTDS